MAGTEKPEKSPEEKTSVKKTSKASTSKTSSAASKIRKSKATAEKDSSEKASAAKVSAVEETMAKATGAKTVKTEKPENLIVELAKKGESPSRIGTILRDQYGVGSIKKATGKDMQVILKENELAGEIPEDLKNLLKRRAMLIKHNSENQTDSCSKRCQQMVEARIMRLSKYYQKKGLLPKGWKYKTSEAVRQW